MNKATSTCALNTLETVK